MSYKLEDFIRLGLYRESPLPEDVDLGSGKVVEVPLKIKKLLQTTRSHSHNGDFSRQDSSVITAMLSSGISPADIYTTFLASPRGKNAAERKNGHLEDYVQRTIRKASSFLNQSTHISLDFGRTRPKSEGEGIITVKASEVEIEHPQWIWPGFIPGGRITIIAGDPGLGKSTLALDIVSRISRGTFLPFGGRTVPGTCLVASAEDATADTIVPRLIASGAKLDRVEVMKEVIIDGETSLLSFPRDLSTFRDAIIKRGARIAVIDPLNAFLAKETDSYKDQDVRLVLAPFEAIAEETGAAIVIVAHLNKKEDSSMIYRVGGSIGLIGAARSVLAVSQIPNKDSRALFSIKANLSKRPQSLEYAVRDFKKVRSDEKQWKGEERVISSTIKWLGPIDFNPAQGVDMAQDKAERTAEEFLRQIITDGAVDTEEIFRQAKQAGVSKSRLLRVKDEIGIQSSKQNGKWFWKFQD